MLFGLLEIKHSSQKKIKKMCVCGCTCAMGACGGPRITCRRTVLSWVPRIEPWLSGSRLANPKGPILETFQAVSGIPFCFDDLSLIPETHVKD